MMIYLLLILGFVLLTVAANWLVNGASGLAKRMNVSNLVIGLTIVAFGTSAPELVVNLVAAINGTSEIAITNILGSNTINTLVILGVTALIYPIRCRKSTFYYEIPMSFMAGFMVLLMGTNVFGLIPCSFIGITRIDGIILLFFFVLFLFYNFSMGKRHKDAVDDTYKPMKIWKAIVLIIVGLAGLVIGGRLIVDNAVIIAKAWGVSEAIIGVTIVALGTSLPELATSAVAAFKKNTDLAIGNVIGSNIFNVFMVLGLSSVIKPLASYPNLMIDASVAAGSSLLLLIFLSFSKQRKIGRVQGAIMLLLYAGYLVWLLK